MFARRLLSILIFSVVFCVCLALAAPLACQTDLAGLAATLSAEQSAAIAAVAGARPSEASDDQQAGREFSQAKRVNLDSGALAVSGRLADGYDRDVFAFGPVRRGDLLSLDVRAPGADLRAAIFDESQNLIQLNDDRNFYSGVRDPLVQTVLRDDHETVFVVVCVSPRSRDFSPLAESEYTLTIARAAGRPPAPPKEQVVWLELGGGTQIRIAGETPQDVPPFDAGAIGEKHKAGEAAIIESFIAQIAEEYAPYNLIVLRSDRDTRPAGPLTVLFFGGYSTKYLGLSDNVDYFNAELAQEGIIYTETLSLFESLNPSDEQIARAIGNVAVHELGHLLGLEHTSDAKSVMSEAASAQQVLSIREVLMAAPLSVTVFPIGRQDSVQKVVQAVGSRQSGAPARARTADRAEIELPIDDLPLDALGLRFCDHR